MKVSRFFTGDSSLKSFLPLFGTYDPVNDHRDKCPFAVKEFFDDNPRMY